MKQEGSQLNVRRIQTTLKRRGSAKAVLEGRDIGEVVQEPAREYFGVQRLLLCCVASKSCMVVSFRL